MNYVLVFRPEVREELNEAYDWYESQKQGLGDNFLVVSMKFSIAFVCCPNLMQSSIAISGERSSSVFPMPSIIESFRVELL